MLLHSSNKDNINMQERARKFVLANGLSESELKFVIEHLSDTDKIVNKANEEDISSLKTEYFVLAGFSVVLILSTLYFVSKKRKKNNK